MMGIQQFVCDKNTAVVETKKGKVRGYVYGGLTIFKGIPYAKAKRFHSPVETEKWEDVMECTSYGFVCPLLGTGKPGGELRVPHRFWPMDEDCQNLNVWTPGLDDKKRPVVVWLHGGGYEAGSAIEHKAYSGANMSRLGDVVVVSVNHRLNILGYFDMSDFGEEYANSGNAGGDDIIMALRWVHDNIANFGGDPDNVTVAGQSGGGAKVTTLLQSPAADGLYHKGIIMSGVLSYILPDAVGSAKETAQLLMKELNVSTAKELEEVDVHLLFKAFNKIRPQLEGTGKNIGLRPHPNATYVGEPATVEFREETKNIPLLVGSVFGEVAAFGAPEYDKYSMSKEEQIQVLEDKFGKEKADKLIALFEKGYPMRHVIDVLMLDYVFRGPQIPYVAKRSALNDCTWSYLFNMDQPIDGGCTPWHCSDIPYFFHNIDLVPYTHAENVDAQKVQEEIFQRVMAFVRTGNPNADGFAEWEPSRPGCEKTLMIDEKSVVRENIDHELLPFLQECMTEGLAWDKLQH